ncbi:MAG: hypothetical protein CFH15_01477 [Alphaproteobacteria bacterium MarineAlpha5_Bin5]|nr:MAG: hypothetical protein CFH15_01477 [Alphaproteobacteria bacterium MarineAlpha5_Bin5]PPR49041.1 MAG: hypothetical protein CFH14_01155 [Alphaproteobacteria bacterium MarineAlpha5_Bin4]
MVDIWPFYGTRPFNQDAKNLIAPSTDHLTIENLEIFKKNNYWNYLKILNPVGQLKEKDSLLDGKLHFDQMKDFEVIKKDQNLNFYIYEIKFTGHMQLGFLSLASIKDFTNNTIKAHEKIYQNRMIERAQQMQNLKTQIGPIYVIYEAQKNIENLLKSSITKTPTYDFESFDKSNHKLWCVEDKNFQNELIQTFKEVKNFYIADGHHRVGAIEYLSNLNNSKIDKFMISAFPSNQSKIFDYNRVIKDLNGYTKDQFINILQNNFRVKKTDKPFKPLHKKQFGMYNEKNWYCIDFIGKSELNNFIEELDINILNEFCLKKILNIKDVNNDERIRFIAGCHGLQALEKKVNDNPDSVAFSIFPSEITDVMKVADNNLTMPPKSTWFDPKPLDGLVVYEFEN